MAYKRFKVAELNWPPATLATDATLRPDDVPNVASVANVAEGLPISAKFMPPTPATDPSDTPKSDAELYTAALKQHGPTSYGAIAVILGWGMTRSGQAETVLREAGLIKYDNAGRGRYVGR